MIRLESERIVLQSRGQAPRLTMQLRLRCEALPCDPQEGVLVFVSRRSDETYRDEHTITIAAGGVEIVYPGPAYGAPRYENRDLTEQITVPIAFDDVREIAERVTAAGVPMVLAADSTVLARHAAAHGLVAETSVAAVEAAVTADE